MSTILKALRRLEEDDAKGSAPPTADAASSAATEVLRDRILAEEAASRAVSPPADETSSRSRKLILTGVVAFAIFCLAVGAIYFLDSNGGAISPFARDEPQVASNAQPNGAPTRTPPPVARPQVEAPPAVVADRAAAPIRRGSAELPLRRGNPHDIVAPGAAALNPEVVARAETPPPAPAQPTARPKRTPIP